MKINICIVGNNALAAAMLAVNARELPDTDIQYVHSSPGGQDRLRVLAELAARQVDIVGLSCYVWNIQEQLRLATLVKKQRPGSLIVLGGPEASTGFRRLLAECPDVDAVVVGEGEISFRELLRCYQTTRTLDERALPEGVAIRAVDGDVAFRPRPPVSDLDLLGSPLLEGDYGPWLVVPSGEINWEIARGCPFRCTYCYETHDLRSMRAHSLARLRGEIIAIERLPRVSHVWCLLPTFNVDAAFASDIVSLVESVKKPLAFFFEGKLDIFQRELFARIIRSDRIHINFGLQTTNPKALAEVGRPLNWDIATQTAAVFAAAPSAQLKIDLMYGLPRDTSDDIRRTLDDAIGLCAHRINFHRLAVLPETDMARDVARLKLCHDPNPPYNIVSTEELTVAEVARWAEFETVLRFWNTPRFLALLAGLKRVFSVSPSQVIEDTLDRVIAAADCRLSNWVRTTVAVSVQWRPPNASRDRGSFLGSDLEMFGRIRELMWQALEEQLPGDVEALVRKRIHEIFRYCCDHFLWTSPAAWTMLRDTVGLKRVRLDQRLCHNIRIQRYSVDLGPWIRDRTTRLDGLLTRPGTAHVAFPGQSRIDFTVTKEEASFFDTFRAPISFNQAIRAMRARFIVDKNTHRVLAGVLRRFARDGWLVPIRGSGG